MKLKELLNITSEDTGIIVMDDFNNDMLAADKLENISWLNLKNIADCNVSFITVDLSYNLVLSITTKEVM